jgi:hypothetical protein
LRETISAFITGRDPILHFTRMEGGGDNRFVDGYIENSLIGALPIPPEMRIAREDDGWKWIGNGGK